jgi:two-component system, cell cycle sensor histidine kinase and response regulator CckA
MKVLLAEDDPDQLSLRSMLLERSGFETIGAADHVSAAEVAASQKPECAVIDLRLPTEECGLWLITELKRIDPAIHIVVLTGGNPERLARQTAASLVEEVVLKGASSEPLIRKLKSLAARSCV